MMAEGRDAIADARARGITDSDELAQIGEAAADAIGTILRAGVTNQDLVRWGVKSTTDKSKLAGFIKQGLNPKGNMYFYEFFNRSTFGFSEIQHFGINTVQDLGGFLYDAERWGNEALEHIFKGQEKFGDFKGFHYDGYPNSVGKVKSVVTGSKGNGVYTAKVESNTGVLKLENSGMSTFFPDEWTPKQVFDAINEAFWNKQYDSTIGYWVGTSKSGMKIRMVIKSYGGYVDGIVTAYPHLP
jgi:hypothetical protein